ncbi:MAG: polyhydroxyalkanoic acid system family protein [Pirellulaceae bacterium]|nr:polyhydroxyalkanoic acid system family protein [Pirellulaceae bacterium]
MPKFNTEVAHQLGQEEASERLKGFMDKVQEQYKDQVSLVEGNWEGHVLSFSLTTFGFKIDGRLDVQKAKVQLDGTLPFAAVAFRGKIETSIAAELAKALA